MNGVLPLLGADGVDAPRLKHTLEIPPPPMTSAVTRTWSHVDQVTLFTTFAATSFVYALVGQPLVLAVARQQCSTMPVSVRRVLREEYAAHGTRGIFRGAGVAIAGTVMSELVYYLIVEYSKEHLPFRTMEQRSLGGGFAADLISGPLYTPFAVVSQVQMVADTPYSTGHTYGNAFQTVQSILAKRGWRALFRGSLLTVAVAPLTGAWWLVYEILKQRTYSLVEKTSQTFTPMISNRCLNAFPMCCTSTTDNLIVNCTVGASTSMIVSLWMNPVYVLRLRLQVGTVAPNIRFPVVAVMRDILHREGYRALFKGLRANLFMSAVGGCAFGLTYEGAKQFSDIT